MNIEKQEKMSQEDYRGIKDRLSYSALKTFKDNRKKFYHKYILGELVEEEKSISLILGDLVDVLLLSPDEFDKKFAVASTLKPIGQFGELMDVLGEKTFRCVNCNGELTVEFITLFNESVDYLKMKGKFKGKTSSSILEQFSQPDKNGTIPEEYYKEIRQNHGKQVVDINMISSAERLVESLRHSPYVGDIVNLENSESIEIHNQLAVLFEVNGSLFKALIDKLVLYRDKKIACLYDLKTTYNSSAFSYQFYKYGYTIQNGVYHLAVKEYLKQRGENIKDWTIQYPQFIVCDTSGNNKPLLFTTNEDNMEDSLHGFTTPSGFKNKGVYELIGDIQKHIELNEWQYSIEALENNGKIAILPYNLVEKEE